MILEELGDDATDLEGNPPIMPEGEEFDADAKAFIGRLILSDKPVTQDEAPVMLNALIWVGVICKRFIDLYETGVPESVEPFEFVMNCMRSIAGYCETTAEYGNPFFVSA